MLKVIRNKPQLTLLLIVIFGFLLRIYRISDTPASLNWDEVSHGYNAFSILKNGTDEWGFKLPIIFRAYGDYKLPIYIYLTSLSELFFGLNAFAVRFWSVIAGTATILFTFLLAQELSRGLVKSNKALVVLGLVSSFLVAVEPWSLFLSRPAFEANLALFLFICGFYFLLKSFDKYKYLPISIFLLGLTVWTYNSYRIFTPFMLVSIIAFRRDNLSKIFGKEKVIFFTSLIFALALFIPMLFQLLSPTGSARFSKVSIIDEGAIGKIVEAREKYNFNPNLERLVFNKYTYVSTQFVKNWTSTFSPRFLFFEGGDNYQFSIPSRGLLYLIDLPFLVFGLYLVLRKYNKSYSILLWIIFAPFAGSITREAPHVLRNITLLPIPMVLTSLGVVNAAQIFSKIPLSKYFKRETNEDIGGISKVVLVFLVIILISLTKWYTGYFRNYRSNYSWSWQYGNKQAVEYVFANYKKYDKIIFTKKYGEPHEFVLFYSGWSPQKYITDTNLVRYEQSGWYWTDSFDKFVFVNEWDIPTEEWQSFQTEKGLEVNCVIQRCLLVTDFNSNPKTWNKILEIKYLDGKSAYEVYDNLR